jgi:hypothetical protein
MPESAPPLACDLGALGRDEQARRAALAGRVTARFLEVRETADGYAARIDADATLAREVLDWFLLERRCCPFLRLEMRFDADGATWLGFGGGPGVKEFLAANGLAARRPSTNPGCGC